MSESESAGESSEIRCAECNMLLAEGQDREETDDAVFCRPCFNNLTAQLQQAIEAQGSDINYSMAAVGALLGGALGVLAWWGFTVMTNIAFGLIAVVIGLTVGKGTTLLAGDKRSRGLQILSVIVAAASFFYASYLVTRTFVHQAWAEGGMEGALPWLPNPGLFFEVVQLGFGFMDLVFLAFVVYEAWKIPAPLAIAKTE
jgi:hypothetical protein